MTLLRRLGLVWHTDHDPDGYGGTWHREYTVGVRLRSHSIYFAFTVGRFREKGR